MQTVSGKSVSLEMPACKKNKDHTALYVVKKNAELRHKLGPCLSQTQRVVFAFKKKARNVNEEGVDKDAKRCPAIAALFCLFDACAVTHLMAFDREYSASSIGRAR